MPQRAFTQTKSDQANDLSDELMTVMTNKQTTNSVGVVAAAFLMAKALLTLSNNNKAEAHATLDNAIIPNIRQAIDQFEFSDIKYN